MTIPLLSCLWCYDTSEIPPNRLGNGHYSSSSPTLMSIKLNSTQDTTRYASRSHTGMDPSVAECSSLLSTSVLFPKCILSLYMWINLASLLPLTYLSCLQILSDTRTWTQPPHNTATNRGDLDLSSQLLASAQASSSHSRYLGQWTKGWDLSFSVSLPLKSINAQINKCW